MTFSFSLYATSLQVILVTHFERVLGGLRRLRLPKSVNFQNKLLQCKLLVYIPYILSKVSIWNRDY